MAINSKTITDAWVKNLKPTSGKDREEWRITGYRGLVLRITKAGHKSWIWYYTDPETKKQKKLTAPAAYPAFGLADAQAWATDHNKAMAQRGVVLDHERAEQEAAEEAAKLAKAAENTKTVRWFLETHYQPKWIPETRHPLTNKINEEWRLLNKHLVGTHGEKPIADVTFDDLNDLVMDVFTTAPRGADRFTSVIKTFFKRARAPLFRKHSGLLANPAEDLEKPDGRIVKRMRYLQENELIYFFRAQSRMTKAARVYADLLSLLLDVGGRVSEGRLLTYPDFDFSAGVWNLMDTKNGHPHRMLLPPAVLERVKARRTRPDQKYVFESTKKTKDGDAWGAFNSQSVQMPKILAEMRKIAAQDGVTILDWSAHDLRRTFNTLLKRICRREKPEGLSEKGIEQAINHVDSKDMEDWYDADDYFDDKAVAYRVWQDKLTLWREQAEAAEVAIGETKIAA